MERDLNQKKDLTQKKNITRALVDEHRLILRMISLLERNAPRTADGSYSNWKFYLDGVDFIRNFLLVPYRAYRKLPVLA